VVDTMGWTGCLLRALWVGQEEAHPRLRAVLAPGLQERHLLRGWTADVRPLYAAMDVLAMPSEWLEPFGRVSIEAQACGVPVLGSRIGGIPETLREGEAGARFVAERFSTSRIVEDFLALLGTPASLPG
jgi:glycosyltransferase involved in cell wall biosynthesis